MTNEELFDEVKRRIELDEGLRYDLSYALRELNLCVDDLEPDTPRRLWVIKPGNWLSPRCETNPFRSLPAPLMFLGGDEFGNRPLCVRLPGHRLLCLNLNPRMSRELWEPSEEEIREMEAWVRDDKEEK